MMLNRVVSASLGARIVSASELEGGFGGGSIYRARVRMGAPSFEQDLIVKLCPLQVMPLVADTDVDARIYAAHSWSLAPVYGLLRERGLPTYDLLGHGFPSEDVPYVWVVMSPLPGVSVRGCEGAPDPEGFQRVCGEALGALHAVTRSYDGAVDRGEPYQISWADAFFESLEHALQKVLARGDITFCQHQREIRRFIDAHQLTWVPSKEFVLSHPDGLQGHARHDGSHWRFVGHLDLEDVSFTDARFPLAGYELGATGPVPPAFWEGYRACKAIDASYEAVRDLFKLYYLLDWFWIVFASRWNPTPAAVSQSVQRHTSVILRTIRSEQDGKGQS